MSQVLRALMCASMVGWCGVAAAATTCDWLGNGNGSGGGGGGGGASLPGIFSKAACTFEDPNNLIAWSESILQLPPKISFANRLLVRAPLRISTTNDLSTNAAALLQIGQSLVALELVGQGIDSETGQAIDTGERLYLSIARVPLPVPNDDPNLKSVYRFYVSGDNGGGWHNLGAVNIRSSLEHLESNKDVVLTWTAPSYPDETPGIADVQVQIGDFETENAPPPVTLSLNGFGTTIPGYRLGVLGTSGFAVPAGTWVKVRRPKEVYE